MARNVRPAVTKRRRASDASSSLDLSSDGGYSALEELSDSEDDDEDGVDAAEEKHIIKDVSNSKGRHVLPPRPTLQKEEEDADEERNDADSESGSASDSDFDLNDIDDDTLLALKATSTGDVVDEAPAVPEETTVFADDGISWNGVSESDAHPPNSTDAAARDRRQVRFAGVPDSDSDSTTSEVSVYDAQFFPDIFVEQNLLDPAFRREIEDESDSSVSSSFWDYSSAFVNGNTANLTDEDILAAVQADPLPDTFDLSSLPPIKEELGNGAMDSMDSMDNMDNMDSITNMDNMNNMNNTDDKESVEGYESDGETTDDDDPQPLLTRRNSRQASSADAAFESSDSDSEDVAPRSNGRPANQPRIRRFIVTPRSKRPVAIVDNSGKMLIFTPKKQRSGSMAALFQPQMAPPVDDNMAQSSPLIGTSSSVMMGAMISSHTFGDYISQHVGPIEAFFPLLASDGLVGEDSDFSGDIIEDDGESNLRIEDFIQFDRTGEEGPDPVDAFFDLSSDAVFPLTSEDQQDTEDFLAGLIDGTIVADEDADVEDTPVKASRSVAGSRRVSFAASSTVGADDAKADDEVGDHDGSTMNNAMPSLLSHLGKNSDIVGAFRRNQIDQQLIYSNRATAESLAFSGPYTVGTLRGIKSGSLEAVTTPITPPRRPKRPNRNSFTMDVVSSPLDPVTPKRKASASGPDGPSDHKRQRSISEVKDLML